MPVAPAKDHHNLIMTTTDSTTNKPTYRTDVDTPRRTTETKSGVKTAETKSEFKTTELIVFVFSVLGMLIAAGPQTTAMRARASVPVALGCM
jgi:hypothetical protein